MITHPCPMSSCGIRQNMRFTMMLFSLHHALIMPLVVRFSGHLERNSFFWLAINLNCKVALRLLMGHLSKIGNHGIMNPIKASLMGWKNFTRWTIQPLSITKACSSILTLDIMGLSMMLISCDIPRFTGIGSNVLKDLFWIPIGWP